MENIEKKSVFGGYPSYPVSVLVFLLCLLPLIGSVSPRFFAFGPGIAGLVCLILWGVRYRALPSFKVCGFVIAALAVFLGLVSSLWAIDQEFAIERSLKTAGVLVTLALLFSMVGHAGRDGRAMFVRVFPVFVVLAGLVCAVNLYGEGVIYYMSRERIEPDFNLSFINRDVVVFLFSAILAIYALKVSDWGVRGKRALYGALIVVGALILYKTHSQSVQISAIIAAIVWFFFPVAQRYAWLFVGVLMMGGVVGAPWLAQAMYTHLAGEVAIDGSVMAQAYMADRMEIWDFVARYALDNPLYGFGIEATRMVEHFDTPLLYTPHDHVLHPHHFALQAWIEFGLIGVAAVVGLIGFVWRGMWSIPVLVERRLALTLFAVMMLIQSTSYGVWQGWWLGLCGFILACFVLVRGFEEDSE